MFPYDVAARHRTAGAEEPHGREEDLRRLIEGGELEDRLGQRPGHHAARRGSAPLAAAPDADMVGEIIVTSRAGSDARTRLETSYAVTTMNEEALRACAPRWAWPTR